MVQPQLVYTSGADLCKLWPREVTTDQSLVHISLTSRKKPKSPRGIQKYTKNDNGPWL